MKVEHVEFLRQSHSKKIKSFMEISMSEIVASIDTCNTESLLSKVFQNAALLNNEGNAFVKIVKRT